MRDGERSLPEGSLDKDAWLSFIGHIETEFKSRKDCPRHGRLTESIATLRLKPAFLPGLKSLETCSHLIVLYWMHEAERDLIEQRPRFSNEIHGTFALRSPNRPNPIAISVVKCLEILPDGIRIQHIDCLDGTPLLDIKPYFPHTDKIDDATVGWFDRQTRTDPTTET